MKPPASRRPKALSLRPWSATSAALGTTETSRPQTLKRRRAPSPKGRQGSAERNRVRRASQRVAQYSQDAVAAREHRLTLLEVSTVRRPTAQLYAQLRAKFDEWLAPAARDRLTLPDLDLRLTLFLGEAFFEGRNHYFGDSLVAALIFWDDRLAAAGKSALPWTTRALRGFKKLAPGLSRAPLPWVAVWGPPSMPASGASGWRSWPNSRPTSGHRRS